MKKSSLLVLFMFLLTGVNGQSLQVSTDPATANNTASQFTISDNQITINNSTVNYGAGSASTDVSESGLSASVGEAGISVYEVDGAELLNIDYDMVSDDNSVKIYAGGNGEFFVRENIANFLKYSPSGSVEYSISNSSQSTEGESVSELASDPSFKTVILYNPKIIRNEQEGSRASIVNQEGEAIEIFSSQDRAIRLVNVSNNGQFAGIITYNAGTQDEVLVTDRFGNKLNQISFDQNIIDARISDNGRYITIRSNSRIAIHEVLSGERVGGTSFRSTLHFAEYIPEDQVIIALTADKTGEALSNVEVHAINIAAQAIQRKDFNSSLGATDLILTELTREGRFSYTLSGFSKKLNMQVSF